MLMDQGYACRLKGSLPGMANDPFALRARSAKVDQQVSPARDPMAKGETDIEAGLQASRAARWDALDAGKYRDEAEAVGGLMTATPLTPQAREAVRADAAALVRAARQRPRRGGAVEGFLQEYALDTREGLALMGLAEALLRTPDDAARDRLIAEAVGRADWGAHLGHSDSLFVNASTWALMLTGEVVDPPEGGEAAGLVRRLIARVGEPMVRAAVAAAIRIMTEEFVMGRTIEQALTRACREGWTCSFDMLGEGARTAADAHGYEAAYAAAIAAVGAASAGAGPERGHGISVKLSALSPRYQAVQAARVWTELYPRLLRLAARAAEADIHLTIDAEEADRLVLSLKLLDRLAREPSLGAWRGLGLAVQAYQKRAPATIEAVAGLARETGRRLMVRLVKGAYWDSEIKQAQVAGRPDYPVFTTKPATDLCYLASAKALIAAGPALYPQFATHNAFTLAAVRRMAAEAGVAPEFQRLHGMGEALYGAAGEVFGEALRPRIYAPVGGHEALLPYLVRRLLENGANAGFVHRLLDERVAPEAVAADPLDALETSGPGRHPRIPLPRDLYGDRLNSLGVDLSVEAERDGLAAALARLGETQVGGRPIIDGLMEAGVGGEPVRSPFDLDRIIGHTADASPEQIDAAFRAARLAQPAWDARGGAGRAEVLRAMAQALESHREMLAALCVREAGKIWPDAIAEVREAADYCRYYALLAGRQFGAPQALPGPAGERNTLSMHGRGVIACISPWNFPLAIFTGQIAAALAAGCAVLAKPAEQTPLAAAVAVRLFHAAGLDPRLLHLTPGRGETVGAALTAHPLLNGVAFTGGTDTAAAIQRALAVRNGPIVPLVAETGGLNGLFVDTTALREQVIDDVIASAFGSAGQRCSSLRLLFLPEQTAGDLIEGIGGAMDALQVGDPALFSTDVGPVIDEPAKDALEAHLARLRAEARWVKQAPAPPGPLIFAPVMAEITLAQLPDREVFGPILHVVRYPPDGLEAAAQALAAKGYGLTLGVHSRLDSFVHRIEALVPAGNLYVNRSIIGAVVGVQPFGGLGLSGTGPKAGGPLALTRFAVERATSVNTAARGGDPGLFNL
jgi:RHH-type proline utilization regulon transcriptional repressor/proline dehydrogenase/delta 1-pyrroline-5-carboxylate dehydrogenase